MSMTCPEITKEVKIKGSMKDLFKDEIETEIIETITNIMDVRKQRLGER